MPVLVKLSQDQIANLRVRKENSDDLAPYRDFIDDMQVGDWAELTPDTEAGENRRTVKRRLTVAARLAGFAIRYHQGISKSEADSVRFQLKTPKVKAVNGNGATAAAE